MRKILSIIRQFFFPPVGASRWRRVLPYAILGILTLAVVAGSVQAWTYTNSPEFCGMACHTMPPEYSAYLRSPHARVQCVECHLGRDEFTTQFTRKAGDLRHVVATLTEDYEFPIYAHNMRPARDSCERCHFPEKFSDDSLRELRAYQSDETNTPDRTYVILKTGGGSSREGLGQGIHWHIENEVWFLATDAHQQEIPYVRTVDQEGNVTEYYDIASDITPEDVAGSFLERMDCITCHNRITHSIPKPDEAIDLALDKDIIASDLPYVRRETVALLSVSYADRTAAGEAFATLTDFYTTNYPDVAEARQLEIGNVIQVLNDIYDQSVFPEQKLDWDTHPENLGHINDPGCFRCHDGKHLTGTEEAIRLECNLCHSIPVDVDSNSLTTQIELPQGPEPPSHTHTSWIAMHGQMIDASCAACHEPLDDSIDYIQLTEKPPADGSFCGNSACHGPDWEFAGFDAPVLLPYLERQIYALRNTSPYLLEGVPRTYEATFKALFDGRCVVCHGEPEYKAGLDMTSYESILIGSKNGPIIVPGDADGSLLIQRQSEDTEHGGQVLADELEALRAWVSAGAP
ncbi:MAG: NapC/NirT family cytochrome c [Anaerolineales bacterium]|nr:NapC/NirT family cytochrome c [Anaerolineales bacterium]MCA9927046.1 NapC/NirT family cytochrome c [Anaerolineales bacterium]